MNTQRLILCMTVATMPLLASAGDGLALPAPESLWPQWQARISVQTADLSPLSLTRLLDGRSGQRVLQGGSVLGDYYFTSPVLGGLRASGGLMTGQQAGMPLLSANAGPRLGLSLQGGGTVANSTGDGAGTVPYLGLGFSGAGWGNSLSVTADLGLMSGRPGAALGLGRAVFGNQGFESALREMRLSPLLQLGVRYTF